MKILKVHKEGVKLTRGTTSELNTSPAVRKNMTRILKEYEKKMGGKLLV